MRARDASTSASWRRTSTRRRAISIASPAAPIVLSSSVGPLGQRRVVDDGGEREAAAAHRRPHPAGRIGALEHPARRVDLDVAVEAEAQLERRVAERLREHRAGALGRGATRAQLLEEPLDGLQARVAGAVEAAVDEQLHAARSGPKRRATASVAAAVASVEPEPTATPTASEIAANTAASAAVSTA